jgi:hypothetical protein
MSVQMVSFLKFCAASIFYIPFSRIAKHYVPTRKMSFSLFIILGFSTSNYPMFEPPSESHRLTGFV